MQKVIFKEPALDFLPNYNVVRNKIIFDELDDELRTALTEDFPEIENEKEEVIICRIKRYKKIVETLKARYHNRCQICGFTFEKNNGTGYSEAHHIKKLADNGSQDESNVVILCANHHRMLHYAKSVDYCTEGNLIKGVTINSVYYRFSNYDEF